jgi:hypothetical protein
MMFVFVFVACFIGSDLCDRLIPRLEEYYGMCVCVSNCELSRNLKMNLPRLDLGCSSRRKKIIIYTYIVQHSF